MPALVSQIVEVYVYRPGAVVAEFLVLRRAPGRRLSGTWHTVYGHIRPGEIACAAARRELAEETALAALELHQLESVHTFFDAGADVIHSCAGFAVRVAASAEPTLNDEHDAWTWLPAEEAAARYHWPGQGQAVREICALILPGGAVADALRIDPIY